MNETTDASTIFAPIWRRKWLILIVAVVVAAASYLYYRREQPTYQAGTQVFLGAGAEEEAPGERGAGGKARSASLTGQAAVINTIVVEQVRRRLKAEHKTALTRGAKVRAKAPEKSEFIMIQTEAHSARAAATLANLTARAYIRRRTSAAQHAVEKAIAINRRQLRRIEAAGIAEAEATSKKTGSGANHGSAGAGAPSPSKVIQEASLSSKINQLESSLGTVTAQQVKPATAATALLLSPKPRKDAIFGFVIGLVLAAIAAYAFSRFDPRLRSIAAIESHTGLPLLAAMPKVRRPIVRRDGQPPRPSARLVEPLRRLESALRAPPPKASPGRSHRVSVFVSPDPGDGKSTIVADLALALRDGGEHVVIVEANFRRPIQNRLLGLEGSGRLAAVLTGQLEIDEAAQRVMPPLATDLPGGDAAGQGVATAVEAGVGSLFVLGGDRSVANPPALLAQDSAVDLLRSLAERFDYVLIDAPSPLEVSDVLPLLGVVDQVVVVARVANSREVSARRLRELLQRPSCAPVAGVVANCVAPGELKRYGFSMVEPSSWPVGRLNAR